jgi:cytoskeletal protein CcmA (bactofilin family)
MIGKKNGEDFGAGGNLNTMIGKGSSFEGTLKVQSTLRVDGKIKGNVSASESLVIGKEGDISGEVSVRNAIIGGKLKGKLNASGKVVLEANSVFLGELKTTKLVIHEGAVFEGNCLMDGATGTDRKNEYGKSVSALLEKEERDSKASK